MTDNSVLIDRDGAVTTITLNNPARHNSLTPQIHAGMISAFESLRGDTECRAVVLCGAGKSFCSGMDLKSPIADSDAPGSVQSRLQRLRASTNLILTMREIPQPIIVALQGHSVGAGFAFAAASDIRIAAPDAKFNAVFVKIGMTPGDLGLSWLLPRLIGYTAAAELFYTGGVLDSERAEKLGFLNKIVDDPLAAAQSMAAEIASNAPFGIRMTKELLNASIGGGFREHMEIEMRSQVLGLMTQDHKDAVAAFPERRMPVFRDL